MSRAHSMLVTTAPTSTTNMTGFFTIFRGSSLTNESRTARRRMPGSVSALARECDVLLMKSSENLPRVHQQMLENRSQAQRREKRERAHDQDGGDQQRGEQRPGDPESAQRFRGDLFPGQISRNGEHRDGHEKSAEQHGHAEAGVEPQRVRV